MKKALFSVLFCASLLGFAQEGNPLYRIQTTTNAQVSIDESTGNPSFIRFGKPKALGLKAIQAKDKAAEFLAQNYKIFNLASANDMVFATEMVDNYGLKNIIYKQYYKGVPVFDGVLKFHFDKNDELAAINGNAISKIKLDPNPEISAEQAADIAKSFIEKQNLNQSGLPLIVNKNQLLVFPKNLVQGGAIVPYLAYQIELTNRNDVREFLFIDAHTGELVEQFTGIHPIDRRLYETNTQASNLKWKEGDPFPGNLDKWQQSEVETSAHVYNFFKNAFGYVSYDNADHAMITINNNPNINCPNANWNGSTANYCTGVAADDVVAHEWGHAYTEYTSGLIYQYQSGALNESYSDVWGETIDLLNGYMDENEVHTVRTTSSCSGSQRWKMGEQATAFGGAIRDLWNPSCNGDPAQVQDSNYHCATSDSGGVHTNSGVPNHLYALLVDGGTYNGYTINGIGFVKAAHLWWRAQSVYLTQSSNFSKFADALESACADLIGINLEGLSTTTTPAGPSGQSFTQNDVQNLQNALLAVGLRTSPSQCNFTPLLNPNAPSLCEAALSNPLFKEDWENGIGDWVVSNIPTKPSTWEERNWEIKSNLPKGREGKAIFAVDPVNGDCASNLQNGILRLESPLITFPTYSSGKYEMAINHYVATEATWDGGNIKYSLNGGAWTLVPITAFTFNRYNSALANSGSDNPLKGQRAFTGTDSGGLDGSWGQSVIDLSALGVTSGSNIKFRFEFGTDGCNGVEGWYVDEIYVYNCSVLAVEDVEKKNNIQIYPNPTSGFISIENKDSNIQSVEIFNVAGQMIQKFNLGNVKNAKLDMSKLNNGTYILKVNSDNESNTAKVIKK